MSSENMYCTGVPPSREARHWKFLSGASDFDGLRIVREALKAGLELFEITRGDVTYVLCTSNFFQRAKRAGVTFPYLYGPWVPCLEGNVLALRKAWGKWDVDQYHYSPCGVTATELWDRALKKEAEKCETIMLGFGPHPK